MRRDTAALADTQPGGRRNYNFDRPWEDWPTRSRTPAPARAQDAIGGNKSTREDLDPITEISTAQRAAERLFRPKVAAA